MSETTVTPERIAEIRADFNSGKWVGASAIRDLLLALDAATASQEEERDALRWTVDNVYTIARRWLRKMERLSYTDEERDGWRHVIRLCEKVGCQPRGVLRDNGGSV